MKSIFEKQIAKTVKYVRPVSVDAASGVLAAAYAQMERDFGALPPPLILHSPAPSVQAGIWSVLRETLVVGSVPRRFKEAISVAVSQTNTCPYCVDAHMMALHASAEHRVVDALIQGRSADIPEPQARALVEWALSSRSPEAAIVQAPPFAPADAPEIVGTAVVFHYLNRIVNVFLDESPFPVPPRWAGMKKTMRRMGGVLMQGMLRRTVRPGESLPLLPEAPLPADLSWAAANPAVAGAFARCAAAVEEAGTRALPAEVRVLVQSHVQAWNGADRGMSRRWVEEALTDLNAEHRPAARLALLTALASYQVDAETVRAFCSQHPGDDILIGATAWASFTTARRVGVWLQQTTLQNVT